MASTIELSRDGHVMVLTINRPDKRNALTQEMYCSLTTHLQQADDDPEVRAYLIRGQEDCFTAGNDLSSFLDSDFGEENEAVRFIKTLPTLKKPLIAAVAGSAVGVGSTLLPHCDMVIAADNAKFVLPFVNIGIVPEAASSTLIPQMCGGPLASELLLLGEPFGVDKAKAVGLVNYSCPADQLMSLAMEYAQKFAARPPEAMQQAKALLKLSQPQMGQVMQAEFAALAERLASDETRRVIGALINK
ncbi:Enoyl-CoA hydratase/carnithine racemase [Ferrimonas sediminum]|uniref:Enoyl-CoA hydratase/carnithine racemase n=1 Tax=Ferrimonas sediminum TaxID=718193 RepID=A0A1G8MI69_9GAMM|nr:enoyl-CoA hydratase-related protein [Ferrimonas sediminum]SDI67738.1 Enoyl-CoA hydratase/carnithine racemase [Ferrimonas sediminum]